LLPPDEGPDEGIPDFWLTAIVNHDMVGEYVKEQDAKVLSYLSDVRVEHLTGEDAGSFKLVFSFSENPFFTSKVSSLTAGAPSWFEVLRRGSVGSDAWRTSAAEQWRPVSGSCSAHMFSCEGCCLPVLQGTWTSPVASCSATGISWLVIHIFCC